MALLQNVIAKGTHAARPAAGSQGVLYYESDTYKLFRDSGSVWDELDLTAAVITQGQLAQAQGGTGKDTSAATNGQLLIGKTSDNSLNLATLTAGSGVTITNGAGTITVAASGAAGAMTQVTATVLSGTAASFDFTSIAGSGNALEVHWYGRTNSANSEDVLHVTANNDSGSNYEWAYMQSNGSSSAASGQGTAQAFMRLGVVAGGSASANFFQSGRLFIPAYANTTGYKSVGSQAMRDSGANPTVEAYSAAWKSTSAITRLTLTPAAGSFVAGSQAVLYLIT